MENTYIEILFFNLIPYFMRKIVLFIYFMGLSLLVNAQTFQEYLTLFPDISQDLTWTGEDLEKLRVSGKNVPAKFGKFIDDTGLVNEYRFPAGKLEVGGNIIVFYAEHSNGYQENYDTQLHLHARTYNKKGEIIPGGLHNYVATNGGVPNRFSYSFVLNFNFKDKKLVVDQKATDAQMQGKTTYKVSKKGLLFERKD